MLALSESTIFLDIIEVIIYLLLFSVYTAGFQRQHRFLICSLFACLMLGEILLEDAGSLSGLYATLLSILLLTAFCYALSNHALAVSLFLSGVTNFMNITCQILSLYLMNLLVVLKLPLTMTDVLYLDIAIACSRFFFLLIGLLVSGYLKKIISLELAQDWWYVGGIFMLLYLMFDQCYHVILSGMMELSNLYIILLSLIGIITFVVRIIASVDRLMKKKSLDDIRLMKLHGEKETYDFLDQKMKEMRSIRHDFKYFKDYIDNSQMLDKADVLRHLTSMEQRIGSHKPIAVCGYPVYDMALYERAERCRENGNIIQIDQAVPIEMPLDEHLLYLAFCEMLDYAITNSRQGERLLIHCVDSAEGYQVQIRFKGSSLETQTMALPLWLAKVFPHVIALRDLMQGTLQYEEQEWTQITLALKSI